MDRRGSALNVVAACAALVLVGAAAPEVFVLREQAWTAQSGTLAHDLTHAPGECVTTQTPEVEIGRALFRSPVLFGGPAARAGLSCNACHSNGGVNAHFFLPELTNAPAHADVSSEWASRVRGDGVMNPLPIPSLADVATRAGFGHLQQPSLETFVRSVIVEEFQGREPPAQAFDGVVAYLRAMRSDACPAQQAEINLDSAVNDVQRAVTAAETAEPATASLLLLAAQDAIGRIVERLPPASFARDRQNYEVLARELGRLRNDEDLASAMTAVLPGWRARFDAAVSRTARREQLTFFNETTLAAALNAPAGPKQPPAAPPRLER